ncbi:MAG: response regulator [Clostridiaceae bacterium]|nr:response regulator [Clostridiaceae bacterium]
MYKLIIADDEEIIRHGLVTLIDWSSLGFEVTGLFEDGRDVIDYLQKKDVDVILTDVCMFELSGLDIARYVYDNQRRMRVKVCLFSGYQDFTYAQEAIRFGVAEYLLKPIDPKELIKTMITIRDALDRRGTENEKESQPFGYLSSETWEKIKMLTALQAQAVGKEDTAAIQTYHKEFFTLLSNAKDSVVFLAVSILFERIFEYVKLPITADTSLSSLNFASIMESLHSKERKELSGAVLDALNKITNALETLRWDSLGNAQPSGTLIDRMKAYIEEHLSDSLEDIASEFNFNPSYLSRRFRTESGKRLSEYITERRITRAMHLLNTSDLTAKQISSMVGYQNEKYFCSCFKAFTGQTTQEYKRNGERPNGWKSCR